MFFILYIYCSFSCLSINLFSPCQRHQANKVGCLFPTYGIAMSAAKERTSCCPLHFTARSSHIVGSYWVTINKRSHSFTNILPVLCPAAFFVQRYCGRKECQVPPALSSGELDGSLPQISACLGNLGIPSALSRLTLVLSFPCPQ